MNQRETKREDESRDHLERKGVTVESAENLDINVHPPVVTPLLHNVGEAVQATLDEVPAPMTVEQFRKKFSVPEHLSMNQSQRVISDTLESVLCSDTLTPDEYQFAERFAGVFFAPAAVNSLDASRADKLVSMKQMRVSQTMKRYMDNEFGSPVQLDKNELGVGVTSEKPFQVLVVSLHGDDAELRSAVWREVAGDAQMFVLNPIYRNGIKESPIICLTTDQSQEILYGGRGAADTIAALRHEYRHTQRDFLFDSNGELFNFVNEALTSIRSQYLITRVILKSLCFTTDDLAYHDFVQAYAKDDDGFKADCLKKWVDHFGAQGLLFLGAAHNAEFADSVYGGFDSLPFGHDDEKFDPRLLFVERLLELRSGKEEGSWCAVFRQNMLSDTLPFRELSLWKEVFQVCFGTDIDQHLFPNVAAFLSIVEEELTRRNDDAVTT